MSEPSVEELGAAESALGARAAGDRWLTPASIGISVVLAGLFAYYLPYLYLRLYMPGHAGGYLPLVAVFPFLLLLAVNGVLRKLGLGLRRGELTVVLCSLMVSLVTLTTVMLLFTHLPAPVRNATPGNQFAKLFLWGVDTRLMPYTHEDKEREKSAGQFDESLNWYYLGVPKKRSEQDDAQGPPRPAASTSPPAAAERTSPPAEAEEADDYDPEKLEIPWWRWVRRHQLDRDERMARYTRLAERIRNTPGLAAAESQALLAEVAVLERQFGATEGHPAERAALFDELREASSEAAYDKLFDLLAEAKKAGAKTRAGLEAAIEAERRADAERVKEYDRLADRITKTPKLEASIAPAMAAQVAIIKKNFLLTGAAEAAYDRLAELLAAARRHGADRRNALRTAVQAERSAEEKTHPRYRALAERVEALVVLDEPMAKAMLGQVEALKKALDVSGETEAAYGELSKQLGASRSVAAADRKQLESAIEQVQVLNADRARGLEGLLDRIEEGRLLRVDLPQAMLLQIDILRANAMTPPGTGAARRLFQELRDESTGAAYVRLFERLAAADGLEWAARRDLKRAIQRERDFDRHIALDLRVPPERQVTDQSFYGWTGPLVWWLVLLTLFIVLQFCLAALLRRQWVDHEKLLFPHAEILEAVTEPGEGGAPGGSILRNRWMWIGFCMAFLLFLLEGLHHYIPAIPAIDLREKLNMGQVLPPPLNAIPGMLDLHVFVIAIAFLLPSEISFSVWVFVLLDFAVRVYMQATGQTHHTFEPIQGYLVNGGTDQLAGLTVFMFAVLYGGRRHFLGVLRKAIGGGKEIDDSAEPLPYFGAFWGLVFSALAILLWCYAMGMSLLLSILLFGGTLLGVLFLSRVVCELGIVTGGYQEPTMPQYLTAGTLGYRTGIPKQTLWNRLLFMTPTYATWGFLWPALFYGTHVMPVAMTSGRMFRHGPSRRRFTFFILLLTLGVMIVFAVRSISIPYEEGGLKLRRGRHTFGAARHTFENCLTRDFIRKQKMHKPFAPMYGGAISGVIVMGLLLTLRHLFYWWPLHPIGYICVGLSAGVWFSVFIGWLIKRAVLKYGGGKLFRNAIPLFVGLLVGHFAIAGIWLIAGVVIEFFRLEGTYSAIWSDTSSGRGR